MLLDGLGDVNYLAVLVAALAYFAFGAIYFARPVMGNAWMRAAKLEIPEGYRPNPAMFLLTFIAYFVAAAALALIARAIGADSVSDGIVLGVVAGVAFALTTIVGTAVYEMKGAAYMAIHALYGIIGYGLMGTIVTIWK
jgi:Protein of unknown function (DUF1761)